MVKYRTSEEWQYERENLKDTDSCIESESRLHYMCESISTKGRLGMDKAVLRMLVQHERTPFFLLLGQAILTKRPMSSQ